MDTEKGGTCEGGGYGKWQIGWCKIVDRYMPRVADENRAYVMRYPGQVQTMLKKARK